MFSYVCGGPCHGSRQAPRMGCSSVCSSAVVAPGGLPHNADELTPPAKHAEPLFLSPNNSLLIRLGRPTQMELWPYGLARLLQTTLDLALSDVNMLLASQMVPATPSLPGRPQTLPLCCAHVGPVGAQGPARPTMTPTPGVALPVQPWIAAQPRALHQAPYRDTGTRRQS